MSQATSMIELQSVNKWYGPTFQVLTNCSLNVAKGEVVVICGPSGSGKSTLIKCVNALETIGNGIITVNGVEVTNPKTDMPKLRSKVGMVFQHFELFPHMTILENLCIGRERFSAAPLRRRWSKPTPFWSGWGLPRMRRNIPVNFPAVSSSASQSPARWRWIRSPCF